MLTKDEMLVLADLLGLAADRFSNHGCNDYWLEDTPGNRAILIAAAEPEDENPVHVQSDRLITMDWLLMEHFKNKLTALAGESK